MLDVRATGLECFKSLQMAAQRFEARDEPILIDVQQFLKLVFPNKRSVGKQKVRLRGAAAPAGTEVGPTMSLRSIAVIRRRHILHTFS